MKKITTPLGEMEAERISKGPDYIVGYIGDSEVFSFRGVTDFAGYSIAEGGEWDDPQMSMEEILVKQQEARKILDSMQPAINLLLDMM